MNDVAVSITIKVLVIKNSSSKMKIKSLHRFFTYLITINT